MIDSADTECLSADAAIAKIQRAHGILTQMMIDGDTVEIPVISVGLWADGNLVVVLLSDTGQEPLEVYEEKLKETVGSDVPMKVYFGSIGFG